MIKKLLTILKYKTIDFLVYLKNKIGVKYSILRLKEGGLLKIRNIDKVGIALLKGESFEVTTRKAIMSRTRTGMTILDIGSNIGYYAIQLGHKIGTAGTVIAFEPNPVIAEQLRANIQLNKLTNVIIEQVALSNTKGRSIFFLPEAGKESHGGLKSNETFVTKEKINVETEKLDDILLKLGISRVDLIKIDVEGAEKLIFEGASKLLLSKNKPTIIFECAENLCQSFGYKVFDVLFLLNSFGYTIEQFDYGMWLAIPNDLANLEKTEN